MTSSLSAFAAALVERGRRTPDRLGYAFEGERLTYGALLAEASAIAAGLVARGVHPGDRLALVLPAGLPFVRGFAAAMLAGAVPFAIHPGVAPVTAMARAGRGRPALALVAAKDLDNYAAAAATRGVEIAALEAIASPAGAVSPPPVDPESPLFMQLTSGTTGEPRLAVLSHRALAAWRGQVAGILDMDENDVLAGWVPPWHITGLLRFVLLPVLTGTPSYTVTPVVRTLGRWLEMAAEVGATYTSAPDFALRTSVRVLGEKALDLSSIRIFTSGGEAVRRSSIESFEARFGLPGIVRPGYGLSEATLSVSQVRPGEPLVVDASGQVSSGRALPGVELAIVDDSGNELPPGEAGRIRVRSRALFSGYFDSPSADTELDREGWLDTGDWGRLDEAGELFVLGRRRALLKHGGSTYAPRELEEAAEGVSGAGASGAVSLSRGDRGESQGVVLVVEWTAPAGESPAAFAQAVAGAVRHDVGLLPAEVLVVEPGTLPRTENGKLRHAELRRILAAGELDAGRLLHGVADGWFE